MTSRRAVEVQFTKRDAPWNAGDVAELPDVSAAKLIRHGVAVVLDGRLQPKEEPEPDPEEAA